MGRMDMKRSLKEILNYQPRGRISIGQQLMQKMERKSMTTGHKV
jgi:hypothetical protein